MRKSKPLLFVLALSTSSLAWSAEVIEGSYDNGVTLTMTIDPFDAKSHKIKMCGDYVCLIDGKPFYGSDGTVPTHVLSRLVLAKKGNQIALDVSSMYDPMVNNETMKIHMSVQPYGADTYKVRGHFSDGAGAYLCQWLVVGEGSIRTHIGNAEELAELMSEVDQRYAGGGS